MHSKPSRTPGNVSHTVLYDAIFLPHGTVARTLTARTKPARRIGNPYFLAGSGDNIFTNENTRTPGIYRSTNGSVMKYERSSLVIGRLLCNIISGDCTNLYGGFGVFGPKYYQIWSESRLMGPVCWKKLFLRDIIIDKISPNVFFSRPFSTTFKSD